MPQFGCFSSRFALSQPHCYLVLLWAFSYSHWTNIFKALNTHAHIDWMQSIHSVDSIENWRDSNKWTCSSRSSMPSNRRWNKYYPNGRRIIHVGFPQRMHKTWETKELFGWRALSIRRYTQKWKLTWYSHSFSHLNKRTDFIKWKCNEKILERLLLGN